MEELNNKNISKSLAEPEIDDNDLDDLDRFIEKRKIQNEALKKIAGLVTDTDGLNQNDAKNK